MNATKLAPFVLMCVLTLAVGSGVGLALSFSETLRMERAFIKNGTETNALAVAWTIVPLSADPIGDPKPNKPKK